MNSKSHEFILRNCYNFNFNIVCHLAIKIELLFISFEFVLQNLIRITKPIFNGAYSLRHSCDQYLCNKFGLYKLLLDIVDYISL